MTISLSWSYDGWMAVKRRRDVSRSVIWTDIVDSMNSCMIPDSECRLVFRRICLAFFLLLFFNKEHIMRGFLQSIEGR